MNDFKNYLTEASLGRFYQQLTGSNDSEQKVIVILTASRSGNSAGVNAKNNAELRRAIKALIAPTLKTPEKVGYYKVVGTYAETQDDGTTKRVKEDSTVVVIPPVPVLASRFKSALLKLGAKYNQDSIFIAEKGQARLVFTRDVKDEQGNLVNAKGSVIPLGAFHPQAMGLAFTKIKGKSFAFDWIAEGVETFVPSNGDSFYSWFNMVKESKHMIWLSPCRPELTYEENHQRAEAFMSDLKALQYGSTVDGVGQFIIHKIGMVCNTAENETHIDTFVLMFEDEHLEYILTSLPNLIKKHGVRFHMDFGNNLENDHLVAIKFAEDCSTPFDEVFCGSADTIRVYAFEGDSANQMMEYVDPMRLAIAGFADPTESFVFEVEDVSLVTNPEGFNDAMRLSGIAKGFGVTK